MTRRYGYSSGRYSDDGMSADEESAVIEAGIANHHARTAPMFSGSCEICLRPTSGARCPRHEHDRGGWRHTPTHPAGDDLVAPDTWADTVGDVA